MTFEQPEFQQRTPEREISRDELRVRNQMELKLCARRFGFDPTEEQVTSWIDQFGAPFGEHIEAHPELFAQYERDPDGTLDAIEEVMYSKTH